MEKTTESNDLIKKGVKIHNILKRDINDFNNKYYRFNKRYLINFSQQIELLKNYLENCTDNKNHNNEFINFYFKTSKYQQLSYYTSLKDEINTKITDISHLGLLIFKNTIKANDYIL